MRRTEGARTHERCIVRQHIGDRINPCYFQRLGERQARQNGRKGFREQRFACAGRSAHDEIVPARRRNLQRPFHMFLPPHLLEIRPIGPGRGRLKIQTRLDGRNGL